MTLPTLRVIAALLLCSLASIAGCDDNTPVCAEAETKSCYCSNGDPGTQPCNDDGLDFGKCQCPDGGAPSDSGVMDGN